MKQHSSKHCVIVLGGGSHFIPSFRAVLKHLATYFEIILLSEFYIEPSEIEEYKIYSIPKIKNGRARELMFFFHVLKFCFRKKIALIHSHSTFPSGLVAILIKKIFRIPVIVSLNAGEAASIPDIAFGELLDPRRKKINRWVVKNANAVTALTQFQFDHIKTHLAFDKEITLITRGVINEKYNKRSAISKPVKFLSVSYIHPVKDQETLLHAFHFILKHVEATLTIVGQDYENGRIQGLSKKLGIEDHINFVGHVDHDSISDYYERADILLHTSRYEALPAAAIEAMAAGVLVCGTHVGILADLSGECCLTVAQRDSEGLANEVLKLVQSTSLQEKLRTNEYAWTKSHSLSLTVEQYKALYNKILSK